MTIEFRGRQVLDLDIDGIDMRDAPKCVDAYFSRGVWADSDIELTHQELEDLKDERADIFYEMIQEYIVCEAEYRYDSMQDR